MSAKEEVSYEEHHQVLAKSRSTGDQVAQTVEKINQLKNNIAQKDEEIYQLKYNIAEKDEEIHRLKDLLDKVCRVTRSAWGELEHRATQEGPGETLRPVSAYLRTSEQSHEVEEVRTDDTTRQNKTEPVEAVGSKAIGSERTPPIHENMSSKIASKAASLAGKLIRPWSRWSYGNDEIVNPKPTIRMRGKQCH